MNASTSNYAIAISSLADSKFEKLPTFVIHLLRGFGLKGLGE